jgi:hypothetical protein
MKTDCTILYYYSIGTDIALTTNMGAIIETLFKDCLPSHNFTHSAMEAQSVYVQLKDLVKGNNRVELWKCIYIY